MAGTKIRSKAVAKKAAGKKTSPGKKQSLTSAPEEVNVEAILKKAPAEKFPARFTPMLATLVDKPFEEPGWLYEVKWDGYRALAFCNKNKVELKSRNDKLFNEKFYPVTQAVKDWNINAIIDGEIVVVNDHGISDFGALQNWRSEADGELLFYVFDIIWYKGKDLSNLPLTERKAILKSLVPEKGIIKFSDSFDGNGTDFFETAKSSGLEGIIAKKANSIYLKGDRSKLWLKIKANKRQEMVIGGYTLNDDSSKPFSSLLVGVFDGKELVYTGKVGTGFNIQAQKDMMKLFKPLITQKAPFKELPDINKPSRFRPDPPHATATFLKPELVCEISFTEMTSDGIMRHPSFEGMRMDKKPKDVIREVAVPAGKAIKATRQLGEKNMLKKADKKERRTLLNPTDDTQVRDINGHELKFSNLNKFYWPKEKITKRDLINYYYQAAPFILPYLKDRPQSMLRHPDGIKGFSFYYKNIKDKAPDWVETYAYHSESDGEDKEYLVGKDDASLLYMASLGCIEMNPWNSTVQNEDNPDWCIIDLDPSKKTTFDQVIEAALATRDILEAAGAVSYPKTSGSTGIHIYIPLGGKYSYEESKELARAIVTKVQQKLPDTTSIERIVKNRKGKMYLDFLQNRPHATVSAPYSVRPKPGAPVSMPLRWEEVKKGLKITDFNIHNAIERMRRNGDIFKPVLGKGINLKKVMKALTT